MCRREIKASVENAEFFIAAESLQTDILSVEGSPLKLPLLLMPPASGVLGTIQEFQA